jgi:hypothetical protein
LTTREQDQPAASSGAGFPVMPVKHRARIFRAVNRLKFLLEQIHAEFFRDSDETNRYRDEALCIKKTRRWRMPIHTSGGS